MPSPNAADHRQKSHTTAKRNPHRTTGPPGSATNRAPVASTPGSRPPSSGPTVTCPPTASSSPTRWPSSSPSSAAPRHASSTVRWRRCSPRVSRWCWHRRSSSSSPSAVLRPASLLPGWSATSAAPTSACNRRRLPPARVPEPTNRDEGCRSGPCGLTGALAPHGRCPSHSMPRAWTVTASSDTAPTDTCSHGSSVASSAVTASDRHRHQPRHTWFRSMGGAALSGTTSRR